MGFLAKELKRLNDKLRALEREVKELKGDVDKGKDQDIHEMDRLIRELYEKAESIEQLNKEIGDLEGETDDDALTVATEDAERELIDMDIDAQTAHKIHSDCKDCLKKKHKHFKTLERDKKKQEKDKKKKLKENILKVREEEQRNLSLKIISKKRL